MRYQLTFRVVSPEVKPCKSFYLAPEWKFMWGFDGIWPCGAEGMPRGCGNYVWVVEEGGEISKYHYRMFPTAKGSRYCLVFPLTYDTWQAVDEKFRGVSANVGRLAAVPMSRGGW